MPARNTSQRGGRTKDPPLLMGRAWLTGGLQLPGLLAVKSFRTPPAHARLAGIDVRGAGALLGVGIERMWSEPPAGLDSLDAFAGATARFLSPTAG